MIEEKLIAENEFCKGFSLLETTIKETFRLEMKDMDGPCILLCALDYALDHFNESGLAFYDDAESKEENVKYANEISKKAVDIGNALLQMTRSVPDWSWEWDENIFEEREEEE